jgi:hypothetical protein
VSPGTDPQVRVNVEETRQQINRLFEEVARLSEMDLSPGDYYGEFLKRVLMALAAPAGAIWGRTQQGNLQLQFQINMREVGLDATDEGRESHDELLRQAVMQPRPISLPPQSSAASPNGNGPSPGNPTDYLLLLVPIQVDNQVAGLLEVWQAADRHPSAIPGYLQFMMKMAELATRFIRNNMLRQMVGQQQLWVQLEAFARQAHSSLNPVEVGYLVANEGRRLVECDRVSIGVRYGRKVKVEAISGADVVEKRSNLVQLMRALFDKVIAWGEKLVYSGTKDDTLPPDVLKALDAYLAESNSKLLVVLPLKDDRETGDDKKKKPARSGLMMECFEPAASPEQLFARLEVIARHATTALYNAVEHRRIPMRFVWMPLAKLQEGLGGKTKAIALGISAAVVVLALVLIFVPYPLKMDCNGNVLTVTRQYVYPPTTGVVEEFRVQHNEKVGENSNLVEMYDIQLERQLRTLMAEIYGAEQNIKTLGKQYEEGINLSQSERSRLESERQKEIATYKGKSAEFQTLVQRTNSEPNKPGYFWLKSPTFPTNLEQGPEGPPLWTVLNADFKENFVGKEVKPDTPLLRLGYKEGPWEIELKIPQKHIGQVLWAFQKYPGQELDVDLLVRSDPTRIFKGKLKFLDVAGSADPHKDDNNEAEPIVLAYVRLSGDDIPEKYCLPKQAPGLLVSGTEVHAKIRCGKYRMGYSLFYGVWEFLYEKVVFFF